MWTGLDEHEIVGIGFPALRLPWCLHRFFADQGAWRSGILATRRRWRWWIDPQAVIQVWYFRCRVSIFAELSATIRRDIALWDAWKWGIWYSDSERTA